MCTAFGGAGDCLVYPSLKDVCPPGGAKTRDDGRPVMTHPPFMLLPVTKAFPETEASLLIICDGSIAADVNFAWVG